MRKIQVITQKEVVRPEDLHDCSVVVIDVFLATSTIIFLLKNNYEPIYAMRDISSAKEFSKKLIDSHIKLGEEKGSPVEGFLYPDPTLIEKTSSKKAAIICSTNGTRAIESAKNAKRLFVSSILNGHLVAEQLHKINDNSSIVIICSGNNNRFSIEDFVGAGHIIEHLSSRGDYELSDSAKVAQKMYKVSESLNFQDLLEGETARLLRDYNFPSSMDFVIENFEKVNLLPMLSGNKIINGLEILKTQ